MIQPFKEEYHIKGGEIIRQITFGMNDGVVSIFALLAGMSGASQAPRTILISLLAATVAGAVSMAAGEFISGKSERDYFRNEIEKERIEVEMMPDIEKEEIRHIYLKKGFVGKILDLITKKITEDKELWVKEMMIDELGIAELEQDSLFKNTIVIFFAFILGALFPVLPYLILFKTEMSADTIFKISTIITFAGLFIAGSLKRFVTGVYWLKSGIEMLLVGLFAFTISYFIGSFISI